MKKFFVITNHEKDQQMNMTVRIQDYLQKRGCECLIQKEKLASVHSSEDYTTDLTEIPEDVEAVIVLGGDGTLIQAAHDIVSREIPLLGINFGTLGYLTEIGREDLSNALDSLIDENYEIEERMMLEGCVLRQGKQLLESRLALNDVVLNRIGGLRVVDYQIYVNDRYLTTYEADGIIIATPTGSTGYSMSAGGPIVSPCAQMSVVTPICSHMLNNRSIVLAAEDQIRIIVEQRRRVSRQEAMVSFDAVGSIALEGGDCIEIRRSERTTKLIKISKDSFLQNLGKKMRQ